MSARYIPLFASVVIEVGVNDTIAYSTSGGSATITIPAGTYYLRGDGGANDLAQAIVDAFLAALAADPVCTVTLDIDASNPSAVVTVGFAGMTAIESTGSFDLALLGLDSLAAIAGVVTSTLSPTCIWVPTQPYQRFRARYPSRSVQTVSRSGVVRTMRAAAQREERAYGLRHVDGRRVHADETPADEAAAFSAFLDLIRDGRKLELRSYELAAGATTLDAATVESLGIYHLAGPLLENFDPSRGTGPSRWGWDIELRKTVAA